MAIADDVGIVSFDDLSVKRGPPAVYEMRRGSAGGVTVKQEEKKYSKSRSSRVFTVTPTAVMPSPVTAGPTLPTQPEVRVMAIQGNPLGVQCVAFSSREATITPSHPPRTRGAPDRGIFRRRDNSRRDTCRCPRVISRVNVLRFSRVKCHSIRTQMAWRWTDLRVMGSTPRLSSFASTAGVVSLVHDDEPDDRIHPA